jgi:hypothetical protein
MPTSKGDVLYFSNVEWNLFQRPQSLSLEFARRGYRVFYFEPMLSLGNIVHHVITGKSLKLPLLTRNNVFLLRPLLSLSTFRFGVTQNIDKKIFSLWFENVQKKYEIRKNALVMINLPYWWRNIFDREMFPESKIVYDCIDDTHVHSRTGKMHDRMDMSERILVSEADVCFATADELYRKMKRSTSRAYLLPNALSPEHFLSKSNQTPGNLATLPRPLIGFVGALYDHIDFKVFEIIANTLKEGTVVLVGFTNRKGDLVRLLANHRNIYYAGAKPFNEVPAYIKAFDVSLNPFKINTIGNSVNPLKLYEYSIFGQPIVSARTKEMEKYADTVYLYSSRDEIEGVLQQALVEPADDPKRERRIRFAMANSWQARVDRIEQVMGA